MQLFGVSKTWNGSHVLCAHKDVSTSAGPLTASITDVHHVLQHCAPEYLPQHVRACLHPRDNTRTAGGRCIVSPEGLTMPQPTGASTHNPTRSLHASHYDDEDDKHNDTNDGDDGDDDGRGGTCADREVVDSLPITTVVGRVGRLELSRPRRQTDGEFDLLKLQLTDACTAVDSVDVYWHLSAWSERLAGVRGGNLVALTHVVQKVRLCLCVLDFVPCYLTS